MTRAFTRQVSAAALLAGASLATARAAGGQALLDPAVRLGPQYVAYRIGGSIDARISEMALPLAVIIPLGARFNVDLATAYASSRVEQSGTTETITGLTDTQLRANYTLGSDFIVLTAGLNLPTGQSTVKADQLRAAGYIGNDFLAMPISNMGTGFAATGGVAIARPLGAWNVGFGASVRHAAEYDAFEIEDTPVRFQPGDEYRARLGVDRPLGPGRVAFGVTYSAFGDDKDAVSSYSTGDRVVTQAAWSAPMRGVDLFLSGWNLTRMSGERAGEVEAPGENITNLALTAGFRAMGTTLEPTVEVRNWMRDGERAGTLGQFGARVRVPVGPLTAFPGAAFTTGSYIDHPPGNGTDPRPAASSYSLTGWRAMLMLRYGR